MFYKEIDNGNNGFPIRFHLTTRLKPAIFSDDPQINRDRKSMTAVVESLKITKRIRFFFNISWIGHTNG